MSRVSNMKNVTGVSPCGVRLTQIQLPTLPTVSACVKLGLATTGRGGWAAEDW